METETTIALSDLPERYAFLDPASSRKDNEHRLVKARSAIVVVASDWLGRIFVLDAWAGRCSTDALIERIFRTHEMWKLRVFGIEANAMQELFFEAVQRDARLRSKPLPLRAVHQPTHVTKDWRIRTVLQPLVAGGRLFLREDMLELRTELTAFPLSPVKDLVDALASAVKLVPRRSTRRETDQEVEKLLDYLRKTGAPPAVIEEVVRRKRFNTTRWRMG
jgi:predicted phage terminase large subunit-like protein